MDPRLIPQGTSPEFSDPNNQYNRNTAGVYYHPEANRFIETGGQRMPDGSISYAQDEGAVQGDAFRQIGYRKATDEEAAEYRAKKAEAEEKARKEASRTTTVLSSTKKEG